MNDDWISVKDRLPDNNNFYDEDYLVVIKTFGGCLPDGCFRSIAQASYMPPQEKNKEEYEIGNTGYWELNYENAQNQPFEITHWMKSPKLPVLK